MHIIGRKTENDTRRGEHWHAVKSVERTCRMRNMPFEPLSGTIPLLHKREKRTRLSNNMNVIGDDTRDPVRLSLYG